MSVGVIVVIFGACIGSFLNVIALRFIAKKEIVFTSSACPNCGHELPWYELIPVVSFVAQRGKCRSCRESISPQYPIIEILTAVVAGLIYQQVAIGEYSILLGSLFFAIAAILLVLKIIDFRTFMLPDFFIILLSVLAVLAVSVQGRLPLSVVSGVLIGSGFLLLIWIATKGQGIGFGDVKLMIPLGMIFGAQGAILLLFIAFVLGGFVGILLLATKKATPKTAVPFGPYLVLASLVLLSFPTLPRYFFALLGW